MSADTASATAPPDMAQRNTTQQSIVIVNGKVTDGTDNNVGWIMYWTLPVIVVCLTVLGYTYYRAYSRRGAQGGKPQKAQLVERRAAGDQLAAAAGEPDAALSDRGCRYAGSSFNGWQHGRPVDDGCGRSSVSSFVVPAPPPHGTRQPRNVSMSSREASLSPRLFSAGPAAAPGGCNKKRAASLERCRLPRSPPDPPRKPAKSDRRLFEVASLPSFQGQCVQFSDPLSVVNEATTTPLPFNSASTVPPCSPHPADMPPCIRSPRDARPSFGCQPYDAT
ncbi:hypothetical protein DIPPA_16861 [Diplonema papillatum]|nr:hypothetical protein DIPPA_16861 [Diplonema papillatum]